MIIRSLKQHWPARKLEWLMSGFLISWGLYVMFHPDMFADPRTSDLFAGMTEMASVVNAYPALLWGGGAFATGVMRAIALFINGAMTRTPMVRLIGSFISMFIVTQVSVALWRSGVPNMGLVVYPWFVVADLLSSYRAAIDVVYAEKQRHDHKEISRVRDGERSNSSSGLASA